MTVAEGRGPPHPRIPNPESRIPPLTPYPTPHSRHTGCSFLLAKNTSISSGGDYGNHPKSRDNGGPGAGAGGRCGDGASAEAGGAHGGGGDGGEAGVDEAGAEPVGAPSACVPGWRANQELNGLGG